MSTLHKALIEAQKSIPVINKGSKGQVGNREYKYADLPSILEKVMPILHKNGLSVVYRMDAQSDGNVLHCIVFHEEGETEERASIFIPMQPDAQKTGIYITYYRRYLLANILNLSIDEDVDGYLGEPEQQEEKKIKQYPKSKWPYGTEATKEMKDSYFAFKDKEKYRDEFGCEMIKIGGYNYYVCPPGTFDLYKNNPNLPAYTVESLRALNYEGMTPEEKEKFDKENPF